jgi:hypothetical protein
MLYESVGIFSLGMVMLGLVAGCTLCDRKPQWRHRHRRTIRMAAAGGVLVTIAFILACID